MKAVDHFEEFCRSLRQSDDRWAGEPLELEPWQLRMMGEALAEDDDGLPLWKTIVILIPRKNGKSVLLSAVALYELIYASSGRPEVLLAASSDKQGGRLFDSCARFVYQSPALQKVLRVRANEGEIRREDGRGAIIRVSSDPRRLMGYGPSLVIVDELAQFTTPMLERAFGALSSGGLARTSPRLFVISTAGTACERHDSILGGLLDAGLDGADVEREPGLTICRLPASKTLVWSYAAETDDPADVEKVKEANPASWISLEDLRSEAANPKMTAAEKLQLYANVWAASEKTWISPSEWAACVDRDRPLVAGEPCIVGFDGSASRDATCLVGCALEDGFVWPIAVWEKPDGASPDWRVPRDEVDAALAASFQALDVREVAADPYGWVDALDRWRELYGDKIIEYPTGVRARMGPACDRFRAAVLERELRHDGDPVLAKHVEHCIAKQTGYGTVVTKVHPASTRRIDLAVGAIIAFDRRAWHAANAAAYIEPFVAIGFDR